MIWVCVCCSIKEQGLYDYVIFNDDLEDAFAQLTLVARRALAGQVGNGSGSISGPVTLVADEDPAAAASTSSAEPPAEPPADQANVRPLPLPCMCKSWGFD